MPKLKLNLASLIFIGFGLGIAAGLFLGEYCSVLQPVGEGFLLLLQMAVLPYILCALISGIGRLSASEAISLAKKVGSFILVLWCIAFAVILAMAHIYPDIDSAPFFSKSMIEAVTPPNFLHMYIPSNPFSSMASGMVPAVVLFSIFVGIALIKTENKQPVLNFFATMTKTMLRVMDIVILFSPIGIFAITANAAGTMHAEELGKLQMYFIGYLGFWALLCFWILPNLATTLTPFSYRDVLSHYKDVLITAFATGSLFIVLPLMAQRSRDLFEKHRLDRDKADTAIDIVVGTSFNFPDLGKLLTLSFIPFAAWFVGAPLSLGQYPGYLLAGLFSFFGDVVMAMRFLFDYLRIPADTFNLFMVADVPISRFGTMLAAMHTLTLTLLSAAATVGVLRLGIARIGRLILTSLLSIVLLGFGLHAVGSALVNLTETHASQSILDIPLKSDITLSAKQDKPEIMTDEEGKYASALQRINLRKKLRAGYIPNNFPFSYNTKEHGLVGYDIEMARALGKDLGVELTLRPVLPADAPKKLNAKVIDIMMSGMVMTPERIELMNFPATHMDITAALITKDYRREEFASKESMEAIDGLTIGVPDIPYYINKIKNYLPNAKLVILEEPTDFFERDDLDALLYSAEAGSALCILHPEFTVVVPKTKILKLPVGYPVAVGDELMADFMRSWIELKRKDATTEGLYDYWILGKGAMKKEPRWSVIRNVLHWVE